MGSKMDSFRVLVIWLIRVTLYYSYSYGQKLFYNNKLVQSNHVSQKILSASATGLLSGCMDPTFNKTSLLKFLKTVQSEPKI